MHEPRDAQALAAAVAALGERVEAIEDDETRALALGLAAAVADVYGDGLTRIACALTQAGGVGEMLLEQLAADDAVASLLAVAGVHPVPVETRAADAVAGLRPMFEPHGGEVVLLGVVDAVAQVRLEGACRDSEPARALVEAALAQHAPDLAGVAFEEPGDGAGHAGGSCELCASPVPEDHRHLVDLEERRIVCTCEPCWALRTGDARYRPTGMRVRWLDDFRCSDERWASFQIPISLAFFMRSSVTGGVVVFYPSPAGATESELDLESWAPLVADNPVLEELQPDGDALIVNRLGDAPQYAIAPIDECYRLVGLIKTRWSGISGGPELVPAVSGFLEDLRAGAHQADFS